MEAKRYWAGIALGLVTAIVIAWLGLAAQQPGLGYGIIFVLLIAAVVALPLLLALAIVTVVLLRRRPPPGNATLAWMWVPTLCALSITPVAVWLKSLSNDAFDRQHPPIHEQHVNLTGQELRLPLDRLSSPSGSADRLLPANATRTIEGVHYPPRGDVPANRESPYLGDLLREDATTILRRVGPLDTGENYYAPRFDNARLLRIRHGLDIAQLRTLDPSSYRDYIYYHYPDRVEVSPVLTPPGDFIEKRMAGTDIPFVHFHAANLGQTHLARIEVAGQSMPLPHQAVPPASEGCNRAYYSLGLAVIEKGTPITVRWQTLDAPGHWHEATVSLPSLPPVEPSSARHRLMSALLYFDTDATVKAESFMLWDLAGGNMGIQASGIPSGMTPPPCGDATAAYNTAVVQRL